MKNRLLFDLGCRDLALRVLQQTGASEGQIQQTCFADFEVYHRYVTAITNREVTLVGDLGSDSGFLHLYDAASCAVDEDALGLTIVAAAKPGETAFERRVRARAFASIPTSPAGNRMAVLNPDSDSVPVYDELAVPKSRKSGRPACELGKADAPSLVFSISAYDYLADRIVAEGKDLFFQRGTVKRRKQAATIPSDAERKILASRFQKKDKPLSDDELLAASQAADNEPTEVSHPNAAREVFVKLETPVKGRHVVIVAGLVNDPDTMDLYRLANAVYEGGALSLTMVVPYFAYSTMERKSKTGEAVKAKIRSRLLSSVPRCPMGNSIILCDLHNEAMPGCFESGLKPIHLYCGKVVVARLAGESKDWRLASADINRIKWVESMARDAGVGTAYTLKVRREGATTTVGFVGEVDGKLVRMFDDMVRTGGSAIGAGQAYRDRGASAIEMIASHGVLPGGSLAKLKDSGVFASLIFTDSHPRAVQLAQQYPDFVRVESIADIVVDQLTGQGFFATRTLS